MQGTCAVYIDAAGRSCTLKSQSNVKITSVTEAASHFQQVTAAGCYLQRSS